MNMDANTLRFSKSLQVGKAEEIASGQEVCLLALGGMLNLAHEVSSKLGSFGVKAGIIDPVFIKPLDEQILSKISQSYKIVVTLEDNVLTGGFGSAVLEFFNDKKLPTRVLRFGWPDRFIKHASSSQDLMQENGLSVDHLIDEITDALQIVR
jgi:1-deoxy-D-xylulose-5-phosphate synthase